MAKEPFLPLFFGDFLASTAEWEGEERALYLLLLGYQWSLGSLPEEPRRVCKLVGWDWQLFEHCWKAIAPKFKANAGRLLNQRLEQHRAKSHEISEKRAAAGAAGGKASQAIARSAREQMLDTTKANAPNLLDPLSHPIPSQSNPEEPKEKKPPSEALVPQKRDAGPTERIFDHWRQEFRHPRAVLDAKRRKVIAAALASFDEATVCSAISGYKLSPHHMGENNQRTVYDDIELLLRDVKHIESGLNFARAPPKPQMSAVERAREKLRNGNGRVVSEQSGTAGESGMGAVTGLLRRLPDS